jgi:peptide/nickel transport system permease protein
VAMALVVGSLLGLLAGYWGGRADGLVMRLMDAVLSFPPLVLALALGAVLGAGLTGVLIALSVVYTPTFARLMRGQVLSIKARDYVEAARALGAGHLRIMLRYVLPNVAATIIILATIGLGAAILAESALSFLGFGVPPPYPSWGAMLSGSGRSFMYRAPWMAFWPGVAISLAVFGFIMLGDALRDVLDPRLRGGGGRPGS